MFVGEGRVGPADATAAGGLLKIDIKKPPIDLLTLSAHNMYGPAGVGALYISDRVRLTPMFEGGNQEYGLRPGTENLPGIAGMGEACRIASDELQTRRKHLSELGGKLW